MRRLQWLLRVLTLTMTVGIPVPASGSGIAPFEVEPFDADSYAAIRERHAGRDLLVLIWSVTCGQCKSDLARIGERLRERTDLRVVLIATDPPELRDQVLQIVASLGVEAAEHWQFGGNAPAHLRASIDPEWFGEVPRSYLVTADGAAYGFSGRVPEAVLDHWAPPGR